MIILAELGFESLIQSPENITNKTKIKYNTLIAKNKWICESFQNNVNLDLTTELKFARMHEWNFVKQPKKLEY